MDRKLLSLALRVLAKITNREPLDPAEIKTLRSYRLPAETALLLKLDELCCTIIRLEAEASEAERKSA